MIDRRMIKARMALLLQQPFWGSLAMFLTIVEDKTCATMWTDGSRIGYSPSFLDELSEKELIVVWAHEVAHCAYKHQTRRGSRDPEMWNEACLAEGTLITM